MLKSLLLVGTGGFFGSVARYGVKLLTDRYISSSFPYGTFIVNMAGCFIIGLLAGFIQYRENPADGYWLLLATGFCGGFTTFSTFALENNLLLAERQSATVFIYTALSLVLGLLLCRAGVWLAR